MRSIGRSTVLREDVTLDINVDQITLCALLARETGGDYYGITVTVVSETRAWTTVQIEAASEERLTQAKEYLASIEDQVQEAGGLARTFELLGIDFGFQALRNAQEGIEERLAALEKRINKDECPF